MLIHEGFPDGAVVKNPLAHAVDARDTGSDPGSGRSPGVGNGNPLQYSCLENSIAEKVDGLQSMGFQRVGCGRPCTCALLIVCMSISGVH